MKYQAATIALTASAVVLLTAASGSCMSPVVVVSASTTEAAGFGVTNILDGDTETRWSSVFADDQWVTIDLRGATDVDAVAIQWEQAYPLEYRLLTSSDGGSWDEAYVITNFTGGPVTNTFSSRSARYVKIRAVKRATEWGHSIREVEVRHGGQSVIPSYAMIEELYAFHVDVNQAFYAPAVKKTAVLRAIEQLPGGSFTVRDTNAVTVLSGAPAYWGSYWGRHFWTVDFSAVTNDGEYTVSAQFSQGTTAQERVFVSSSNIVAAMDKTLSFFRVQRCGTNIPDWHQACHLDDGVLPGGAHFDASGGWHDCTGGFDKELYTAWMPVYFFAAIAADADSPWRERMIGEARWGADWIMKMIDTNGYAWCHVDSGYVANEDMDSVWSSGTPTDNVPGTGDDRALKTNDWGPEEPCQALAAGALARLGDLLREEDPAYAALCFEKAGQLVRYLMQHADWDGMDKSPYINYHAGRLLADTYLHGTDPTVDYGADARRRIHILANQFRRPDGELLNTADQLDPVSSEKLNSYTALMCMYEFARRAPDDPAVETIKTVFRDFVEGQVAQRTDPTPYGQAQIMTTDSQRNFPAPGGGDTSSHGWNCHWLSMATVCFMADELLETNAYADIAAGQVDWVLGKNPFGVSTVAEVGYRFPRMYTKWAFMEDHPGEDGVMPGGVINGIGGDAADEPTLDMEDEDLPDWLTNEYWNPPTAWFAMACWRYYQWARGAAHPSGPDIYEAYLRTMAPRRPCLVRHFGEGEHYLRQAGSAGFDCKAAASGGQVLGEDWGRDHGDYVDYELFVGRPLADPTLHVRYACNAGTGRSFDVRWDDQYQSLLTCTNTGGWGDSGGEYAWASAALSSSTAGLHKLTLVAQGSVEPVNVDCWYLAEGPCCGRECEDYDAQTGSGGPDFKAGASQGEVLGDGWGITSTSEAVYCDVNAGSQTDAWLHVWYACGVSGGRVLNVYLDEELRAHLVCRDTGGWGSSTDDFDMVSVRIGAMSGGAHALKFTVPGDGDGVNLDGFCIGLPVPDFLPRDADRDGLGDAQEAVWGTLPGVPDTDGDGVPDGDEIQSGRSGQVTDPLLADTDADGMDDLAERISGTDARDAGSLFRLGQTAFDPDGALVLTWPSASNRFYTLSRSEALLDAFAPFTNLAVDAAATPPLNSHTDDVTGVAAFYRLKVRK